MMKKQFARPQFLRVHTHRGAGALRGGSSDGSVPHRPFHTMAEAEKARVKLAKQDRKEANELLVAVGKQDEARVRRLLGIGHDPDEIGRASCRERV